MSRGKTYLAVEEALNGDAPHVDPAIRRTLYRIATEADEEITRFNLELSRHDLQGVALFEELKNVKRLLVTTAGSFVLAIGTALVNVFI